MSTAHRLVGSVALALVAVACRGDAAAPAMSAAAQAEAARLEAEVGPLTTSLGRS
jgi:hypothetical protein